MREPDERRQIMNLIRYEPQLPRFSDLLSQFNRMMAVPFFRPEMGEEALTVADWTPLVDITETDSEYIFKAELPEVKKEDVKVTLEDNVLTLEGERHKEKEEKNKKFHRIERSYGKFLRTFTVPSDADETKIEAQFKDGLLNIHIPKSEKAKPKKIPVKVAAN
jgi:HSP20 family protein